MSWVASVLILGDDHSSHCYGDGIKQLHGGDIPRPHWKTSNLKFPASSDFLN